MLLLLPTDTSAAIEGSDSAKFGLYRVRNSSICAAVVNTGRNSSLDELDKTPDPGVMFGNAEKLPLSECRHTRDFVIVQQGRYALLSNTDVVAALLGRNYSFTFCVNTEYRIDFSCYKSGKTYFVAPTDYGRVLIRGPVGFYTCPQSFEALYGEHVSLIQDKRQCATFLTVSTYGVRTDSGDCVHLFRYALFKEYPEVWNGCQRYAEAGTGNSSFDCQFGAAPEPWNYPTREEVSRCADYAPRVACSSLHFDSKADARYFYAGRGLGEMTQNKVDNESCQPLSTDDFVGWLGVSHYAGTVAIGGGGIILVMIVFALRVMCGMYLCGSLCRREPVLHASVVSASVPFPAKPTASPPPRPNSGSSSVVVSKMRSLFSATPSDVRYERVHAV